MKISSKRSESLIVKLAGIKELPVMLLFAGLFVYFCIRLPSFLELQGLLDYAKQYASVAILAVGLTLVIGSAGIDISVGSVLGFSSIVLGVVLSRTGTSLALACLLAVASGTAFGALNGFAVAKLKLQPVVVTLSTMAAARGLIYVLAGQSISSINLPNRALPLENAAYNSPAPVLIALSIAIIGSILLSRTSFGRSLLATGANEKAAYLSGINVDRIKIAAYTITGALSGIAGILTAGLMNTATTQAGTGSEFEAITAVLMGGTSIMGGEATVIGSVLGVLAVATLDRGFGLMGIQNSDLWRMMCLGLILIASILLDGLRRYIARKSAVGEGR